MDSNEKTMNTLLEGLELYRKKEFLQAKMVWEALLAVAPQDFNVLHFIGMACFNLGQMDKAIAFMDKAIAINPKVPEIYNHRGSVLQELKQFEAAIASHNHAIALKPDMVAAYTNRGNAFQQLKQFEAAIDSHDQALLIQPEFTPALNNRKAALQALEQARYRRANKETLAHWNAQLGRAEKPRVALAWNMQGGFTLSDWISDFPPQLEYIVLPPDMPQSDKEALCEGVDLIISTDSLMIHFSEMLDKPLWLLLPPSDFDWKTGWNRYYAHHHLPYHVKLYPVARQEDWSEVLNGMATDLERCCQDFKNLDNSEDFPEY